MGKLLLSIKARYNDLTNRDKRIADYILNTKISHPLTITELSQHTASSEASIVRFAKKFGFNGYPELKIALAKEEFRVVGSNMTAEDSIGSIYKKVCDDIFSTVEMTKSVLDEEKLLAAADYILKAKEIFIFGVGNSANIASDCFHKLFRLGFHVAAYSDSHLQLMASTHASKNTLVIAFSHSGKTIDILDSVSLAKKNGAIVISITGGEASLLSNLADIALFTKSDETNYRLLGLTSRYSQLAIIDTLYSYLVLHYEKGNEYSQSVEEAILSKRTQDKKKKFK